MKTYRIKNNCTCNANLFLIYSLLYGVEDPSIAGMVLDSPFSNLVDLMMELVDTYKYPLPKFTVSVCDSLSTKNRLMFLVSLLMFKNV